MFIPVGSLIALPFFGVDLGLEVNKIGAFLGVYPALDPLIAIFLITDFRNFVLCLEKRTAYKIAAGLTGIESSTARRSSSMNQLR